MAIKNSGNPSTSVLCTRDRCHGFLNAAMRELHVRYEHDEIWSCAICPGYPEPYSSRTNLCKHFTSKHPKYWKIMEFLKKTSKRDRFVFSLVALGEV